MEKEKKTKKIERRKFFTKTGFVLFLVIGFLLFQNLQFKQVFSNFSVQNGTDSSLIQEVGQIKDSYTKIGTDLNQVRDFLRMPKSDYVLQDNTKVASDSDQNSNELQLALFKYVDYLGSKKTLEGKIKNYSDMLNGLMKSENFKAFLLAQGLSFSAFNDDETSSSVSIVTAEKQDIITFYLSKKDGKFFLKTNEEKKEVSYKDEAEFEKTMLDLITAKKDVFIQKVNNLIQREKDIAAGINAKTTQDVIAKLAIKLNDQFVDQDLKVTYSIFNKTDELIGAIVLDYKTLSISLVDKNDEKTSLMVTDVATALPPFLEKLNTKTFIEKKADQAMQNLKNTLKDDGFKIMLSQAGLTIADQPRIENNRIFYDIKDKDGKVVSSLAVEKTTGVVNIVQPDGTNSQNLLYFQGDDKKKTLEIPKNIPDYSKVSITDNNDLNILIAGEHDGLLDTMIFVHVDEAKKEIKMISIPRDLFYNGRKINAFAEFYGMPELKKAISDMTGYNLDKYIKIDMYAFIDVIDMIGGVDIHLDNAVVDPTYKVVDNGKVGTLHYEPGDYHLSGAEALRLARTRHTTSDFARAERQQKILEALQAKAKNFGFGDAETIYSIAKMILSKTETDISLDEAISYYFRYQNYKIVSNNVMSSGNVLYAPPYITTENCQKMVEAAAAANQANPGCDDDNHAYTLLPLNDDWNVIKWFFRQNFDGNG